MTPKIDRPSPEYDPISWDDLRKLLEAMIEFRNSLYMICAKGDA